MGRIKKKGESGNAKNFISRTQAVKKLQLSLPDFRKLCIWKGIYPREPRDKKKVSKNSTPSTTFYYTKDIQYLLHEPLLAKFRDQKALEKKISRALGRGDLGDASRLERNATRPEKSGKPSYTLDHVIRERYPTFVDAVRDLDDCLSMLFLFANLPSTATVPAKMIARCERLTLEFEHYLIVSHSLRKSFLSIKGIYYQANIQGEDVLWLVPYKFNQRVLGDVDFRIMGTFVEFYMTLLGFVNYRLYTTLGLKYPPKFDQSKDDQGGELGAFTLEGVNAVAKQSEPKQLTNGETEHGPDPKVQAEVNKLVKSMRKGETEGGDKTAETDAAEAEEAEEATDAIDKFEPAVEGGDILPQPSYSTNNPAQLFSKCTVFLGRETPRGPLELILRSFGCKRIGWDAVLGEGAFTTNELDPAITHQIMDRPVIQAAVEANGDGEDNQTAQKLAPNQRVPGRIYVQPQWVWDSINDEELKDASLYAPGAELPPHLSPFVKPVQGQYDPTMALEEQQTEAVKLAADSDDEAEAEADEEDPENDMDVADESDEANEDFDGLEEGAEADESDEEESAALERQRELEAEIAGKPVKAQPQSAKAKKAAAARKALGKKTKEEADDIERAKGMLSKKKRKLFEQMQYTNNKKSAEDEKLRTKRRKIEKQKGKKA
ncbi:unnamed protein product [Discula destructiva]